VGAPVALVSSSRQYYLCTPIRALHRHRFTLLFTSGETGQKNMWAFYYFLLPLALVGCNTLRMELKEACAAVMSLCVRSFCIL